MQSASRPTRASHADQGVPYQAGFSTLLGWAFRPRNSMKNRAPRDLVGRIPRSARDVLVPLPGQRDQHHAERQQADEGGPHGPGGPLPSRFFAPVHPHSVVCLAHMAVKIFKWVLLAAVLIQLIPFGRTHLNPPKTKEPSWTFAA